ncbi:MAG: acetyl/propionyl-CoA carboxylase, alpha subunit protein [Pseudomonadota bacterium]|jgi:3-methylcrotonyl-CoA carboxylase alpha subunit
MFAKILIANRGEIACRVAATARRLGIRTVAVYSDADAQARHVRACDEAWRLGPAPARESYLCGDRILAIALETGAQAIHPGYGFLSENEVFAQQVIDAGLVFIGPPPSAIAAMGSKSAAKALMAQAGVPLVPGYHGDEQDPGYLRGQADAIGYPVLIKASAGGGGKGMRIVRSADEFEASLASCKREAANAFGDDHVLIERYLDRPRHIEIQVFADTHGQCVYLFERDCSVQRRHQKVIEEAPAPGMSPERRAAMGEAAVAAARAVGYAGAGTVEFIAEQDGRFFFMEMNTRLQVEHPVTEMITGLDLVEWQLRVAAGEALPLSQQQLRLNGHAIEARLYAENPMRGFLPSIGDLVHLRLPQAVHFSVGQTASGEPAPVRIDAGVVQGDAITPHYDPMIAKLITWAPDRDQARARLAAALHQVEVVGLATNAAFLARLMHSPRFAAAELDTGLIEHDREFLLASPAACGLTECTLAAAACLLAERESAEQAGAANGWRDPWSDLSGWRLNTHASRVLHLQDGERIHELILDYAGDSFTVRLGDQSTCLTQVRRDAASGRVCCLVGSQAHQVSAVIQGVSVHCFENGRQFTLRQVSAAETVDDEAQAGHAGLAAPMPGKVIAHLVEAGARVSAGQALVVIEAMKMEHVIAAPHAGRVAEFAYGVGEQVAEGAALVRLEAESGAKP